jgi:hypothetical protein
MHRIIILIIIIIIIQFSSIYLFTCKLNSPDANYEANTSREEKNKYKQNTKTGNNNNNNNNNNNKVPKTTKSQVS